LACADVKFEIANKMTNIDKTLFFIR